MLNFIFLIVATGTPTLQANHVLESRYGFDSLNRLRSIRHEDGSTRWTARDLGGRAILETTTNLLGKISASQILQNDGAHRIGANAKRFVYGRSLDEMLFQEFGTEQLSPIVSQLGSTGKLVNAAGAITQQYKYDAFGAPIAGDAKIFSQLFAGAHYDNKAKLYDLRNRHYDPRIGRFLSRDPLGMHADSANAGNAYSYVGNNPLNRKDPLGLLTDDDDETVVFINLKNAKRDQNGNLLSVVATTEPPPRSWTEQEKVWWNYCAGLGSFYGKLFGIDKPSFPNSPGYVEGDLTGLGALVAAGGVDSAANLTSAIARATRSASFIAPKIVPWAKGSAAEAAPAAESALPAVKEIVEPPSSRIGPGSWKRACRELGEFLDIPTLQAHRSDGTMPWTRYRDGRPLVMGSGEDRAVIFSSVTRSQWRSKDVLSYNLGFKASSQVSAAELTSAAKAIWASEFNTVTKPRLLSLTIYNPSNAGSIQSKDALIDLVAGLNNLLSDELGIQAKLEELPVVFQDGSMRVIARLLYPK